MNTLMEPLRQGGPAVWAILGLAVILYTRCFSLLFFLHGAGRDFRRGFERSPSAITRLRIMQDDLREAFARQRATLGAMIAAAPLLGLLGTVTGMIRTFQHLNARASEQSVGLASGISEALVATKAGLSVAIPAVLVLYVGHRLMEKCIHDYVRMEREILEES
jgi:biopolymer transport protein ExbB